MNSENPNKNSSQNINVGKGGQVGAIIGENNGNVQNTFNTSVSEGKEVKLEEVLKALQEIKEFIHKDESLQSAEKALIQRGVDNLEIQAAEEKEKRSELIIEQGLNLLKKISTFSKATGVSLPQLVEKFFM